MDSKSDVEVSDAEDDVLKLEQPAKGWKEAERNLAGYSKTNMGKTPWSRWYYKEKAKKDSEGTLLRQKYGDISRFFTPPLPTSESSKTAVPIVRQDRGAVHCEFWKLNMTLLQRSLFLRLLFWRLVMRLFFTQSSTVS